MYDTFDNHETTVYFDHTEMLALSDDELFSGRHALSELAYTERAAWSLYQNHLWQGPRPRGYLPLFAGYEGQIVKWDHAKWTPVTLEAVASDFQAFSGRLFFHLPCTRTCIQKEYSDVWCDHVVWRSIRESEDRLCSPRRFSWTLLGKSLVPCTNGLLDANAGELLSHTPEFFNLEHNEIAYDPEATCPRFEQLLHKVCPDAESTRALQHLAFDVVAGRGSETIYALLGENDRVKRLIARMIGSLVPEDTVWSTAVQPNGAYRWPHKRERVLLSIADSAVESTGNRKSIRRSLASRLRSMQRGTRGPLKTTVILSESLPDITDQARGAGLEIRTVTPGGAAEVYADDMWDDLRGELPGILNWALAGGG